MVSNKGLIFKKAPLSWPVAGEHLAIETREFDIGAAPPKDGIFVKNFYISFDPYQRGGMRNPDGETHFAPFTLGEPITGGAVSKVIKSDNTSLREGDTVLGTFGTEEYSIVTAEGMPMVRKLENPYSFDLQVFVGPLGVAGLTAYSSFYEIGKPQKGQTIFISSAAGAVGQIVGQLAKNEGLTVIGSVGSDQKLDFIIKELGFDGGFNYRSEKAPDALARLAPKGLDIYYDNVGGEQLDAALAAMNDFGRIVGCGMISQYNVPPEQRYGVKNIFLLVLKRLTLQGFIVSDPQMLYKYIGEFQIKMSAWLDEGKIKTKDFVTDGIDNALTGWMGMMKGENFGKAVLKVADPDENVDHDT